MHEKRNKNWIGGLGSMFLFLLPLLLSLQPVLHHGFLNTVVLAQLFSSRDIPHVYAQNEHYISPPFGIIKEEDDSQFGSLFAA